MREVVLFFGILFIPLVLSVEASINCPDKVYFNQEFICTVKVSELEDIYDLKIYIKGDSGGINRIWDEEEGDFRRADWYLKGFISEKENYEVSLIIHKEYIGGATGEFKIRDSSGEIVINEDFEIEVLEENGEKISNSDSKDEEIKDKKEEVKEVKEEEIGGVKEIKINSGGEDDHLGENNLNMGEERPKKVINLNQHEDDVEEQIVYVSKSERVKDYVVYSFIAFLILIIGVLLFERKNGSGSDDY